MSDKRKVENEEIASVLRQPPDDQSDNIAKTVDRALSGSDCVSYVLPDDTKLRACQVCGPLQMCDEMSVEDELKILSRLSSPRTLF